MNRSNYVGRCNPPLIWIILDMEKVEGMSVVN